MIIDGNSKVGSAKVYATAKEMQLESELEQTKKKLAVAVEWIERIEVTTRVRENTSANRQCIRALKQINETMDNDKKDK